MTEKKLYTLEEASRKIADNECFVLGHSFDEVVAGSGEPVHVICTRCGRHWDIEEKR